MVHVGFGTLGGVRRLIKRFSTHQNEEVILPSLVVVFSGCPNFRAILTEKDGQVEQIRHFFGEAVEREGDLLLFDGDFGEAFQVHDFLQFSFFGGKIQVLPSRWARCHPSLSMARMGEMSRRGRHRPGLFPRGSTYSETSSGLHHRPKRR